MKILCFQTNPRFLSRSHNLGEINRHLRSANADLVIFPELATSGYNFRSRKDLEKVAEPFPGGPTSKLIGAYAGFKKTVVVIGFPEIHRGQFYNSALIATPAGMQVYRKIHLFGNEKKWFAPGKQSPPIIVSKGVKIGIMICFDWFFPEVARSLALRGADIIAHPSNLVLPYAPSGMRTRSLENHLFTATVNRVGVERGLRYIGQTQVLDTKGEIMGRLGKLKPGVLAVKINPREARNKHLTPKNHIFNDRRVGLYSI